MQGSPKAPRLTPTRLHAQQLEGRAAEAGTVAGQVAADAVHHSLRRQTQ